MSVKPILFNTDMARAILEGRKTATRRVVRPRSQKACGFYVTHRKSDGAFMGVYDYDEHERMFDSPQVQPAYPGDILYVQETFCLNNFGFHYRADWPDDNCPDMSADDKWHPSIHMSREAARIFLRVTDVRVERLQDITEEQAEREGCSAGRIEITSGPWGIEDDPEEWAAREHFVDVWNDTVKPADRALYGWDANPWVWTIEFERVSKEEAGV